MKTVSSTKGKNWLGNSSEKLALMLPISYKYKKKTRMQKESDEMISRLKMRLIIRIVYVEDRADSFEYCTD